MNPGGLAAGGAGKRMARQHRRLASNLTHRSLPRSILPSGIAVQVISPIPLFQRLYGTLPRPYPNLGISTDVSTAGGDPIAMHHISGTLAGPMRNSGFLTMRNSGFSTMTNPGGPTLMKQKICTSAGEPSVTNAGGPTLMKQKFCTSAGEPSVTNAGDNSGSGEDLNHLLNPVYGNTQQLCQWVKARTDDMNTRVIGFKEKYNKYIRPALVSRCLIMPSGINDPSTVFLHRQTFDIAKRNPSYLSCFDVMAFEDISKEEDAEWERFLDHLVARKVYIVEDWKKSFSTIEILMYDHGLKQPNDGTEVPFLKGECDAAYDPKTGIATLSYIIWKDDRIIYAEVFQSIKCNSAVEAEMYAACALLDKAEEMNIEKLLVCTDSMTVAKILSGELSIAMNHPQRDFFLMLRSMRTRFKRLVATWKPRELMIFADEMAKANKLKPSANFASRLTRQEWLRLLTGLPVFRIERTPPTSKIVGKFREVTLDDSYGMPGSSIYFIEVKEDAKLADAKLDCLVGLQQALQPAEIEVLVSFSYYEDASDSFKQCLNDWFRGSGNEDSDACYIFRSREIAWSPQPKRLVVVLDSSVPEEKYYNSDAFRVLLLTPTEVQNMNKKIPELTALGFVYFNGVRFPLNEEKKKRR